MVTGELTTHRVPPRNVEAEAAILGAMLIDEEAIPRAIETLRPESFYLPAHRKLFESMIALFEGNQAVDMVTLTEHLTNSGELNTVGGAPAIADLAQAVPTSANLDHYINIVHEKAILRGLIHCGTQIATEGYDAAQDAGELLDRAEKMIFEIAGRKFSSETAEIKDIVKVCVDNIDKLYQRKETITGVPTGFHEFDTMTAGLQPSDLVIVAARPSMGKSAFVVNIAEYCGIIEKRPVALFSLEMSKEQMAQRMLCSQAKLNAHKVRTGFLAQSDWPRLTDAASKLSKANILIDDTPGISVLELRAKARRLKAQHDIQLLIVDYLQLMRGEAGVESRQQEISMISRQLKALAREIHVPLIAVSQLSRAVESRQDHRPQLSDLRESGAIEQDADMVVLLMREEYYRPEKEEAKGKATVIVAKQRNGPVGDVNLAFLREYTRFENLEVIRHPGVDTGV